MFSRFRLVPGVLAVTVAAGSVLVAGGASPVRAQNLAEFEKNVTEFTISNGMHFIVVERHDAPVVSFQTYANVGSVDDLKGATGMAHMFEHMAFKGSTRIGTRDWPKEKAVMDRMDAVYADLRAERDKGRRADQAKIDKLQADFKALQDEADQYIQHDEYEEALERSGGSGLNAGTWYDATQYFLSLPSNKLELWMSLESERFSDPVFREFYKERDVVMEERRMRTDNQPFGKLIEETVATAFKAHPYGVPPIGHMSDLHSFSRQDAQHFFDTYYGPSNLTVAIVGDVNPAQVKTLAETYFGRIPARPVPPAVETVEPEQLGERRVTIEDPSQPLVMIVYHKPDGNDPDNAVFDTITDIMGAGRTSRLYKTLVKEKKIAIAAGGFSGLLGNKYPNLFVFFAVPSQGHTPEECEAAIYEEIDKMKDEMVTADELQKSKTRSRASLVRQLQSDSGLAAQLAEYQVIYGDWRKLFTQLDDLNAVTAADVQRVAKATFTTSNRTVGTLKTAKAEDKPQS